MKSEVASPVSPEKQRLGDASKGLLSESARILVPVANPNTEDNLLHLALILAKTTEGILLPLHILSDKQGPISADAKAKARQLLAAAETIAHAAVTAVEPIGIDDSIDKGIVRAAFERNANLIVCGWKGYSTTRDNFFGSVIDNVVHRANVPVLVARFSHPIQNTNRVFLAFTEIQTSSFALQQTVALAQTLAVEFKASLQVLQVMTSNRASLNLEAFGLNPEIPIQRVQGSFVGKVSKMIEPDDLLILTAETNPHILGLPSVGIKPEAIARSHTETSIIVVHFPRQTVI